MRELDKARAYAESLIKIAPDPVFVSGLDGKSLQANDAVFALLGFRPDELIEQSLSRIISPEETRAFLAALREVVERGVTRNARLNPRSASGEVIPTTLDRKSTRLNSSHGYISYAVFCLKKKKTLRQFNSNTPLYQVTMRAVRNDDFYKVCDLRVRLRRISALHCCPLIGIVSSGHIRTAD